MKAKSAKPKGDRYPSSYSFKVIRAAIIAEHGNIAAAARTLDCNYDALVKYVNRHPELNDARKVAAVAFVDLAQEKLKVNLETGDRHAIETTLRYWGKFAGLGERHELTGADGEALLKQNLNADILSKLIASGETPETILLGMITAANEEYDDATSNDMAEESS